jgi:hypothetical protein
MEHSYSRLSLVLNLYLQGHNKQPYSVSQRHSQQTSSCVLDVWNLQIKNWEQLKCEKNSLILIVNNLDSQESENIKLKPVEEQQDHAKRILELRMIGDTGIYIIVPGAAWMGTPTKNLEIRSQYTEIPCSVYIFPR